MGHASGVLQALNPLNLVRGVGDAFKSPKLPKVQPPAPPVGDTTADQDAIGQANLLARQAARRRLGVLATLGASSSAATGIAGSPRTNTGGLIGS